MALNWNDFGEVALVSIGATVGVVIVFSLGVRALVPRDVNGVRRRDGARVRPPTAGAKAVAALCFLACAAAVAYGLYLIVPQFH